MVSPSSLLLFFLPLSFTSYLPTFTFPYLSFFCPYSNSSHPTFIWSIFLTSSNTLLHTSFPSFLSTFPSILIYFYYQSNPSHYHFFAKHSLFLKSFCLARIPTTTTQYDTIWYTSLHHITSCHVMSCHVTSCHCTHVYHRFKERKSRNEINSIIVTSVVVNLHSVKHVYMNCGRQAGGYVWTLTSILSIILLNQRTHTHTYIRLKIDTIVYWRTRAQTHTHTQKSNNYYRFDVGHWNTHTQWKNTHTHSQTHTHLSAILSRAQDTLSHTHTHTHTGPTPAQPSPLSTPTVNPHPTPPILQFPSPELNSREINAKHPSQAIFITYSYTHTHSISAARLSIIFIQTTSPSAVPIFIYILFLVLAFISFQYFVTRICFVFLFVLFIFLLFKLSIYFTHTYTHSHIFRISNYCKNNILYAIWYADNSRSSKFYDNTSHRF